jgi:hypothetical protein
VEFPAKEEIIEIKVWIRHAEMALPFFKGLYLFWTLEIFKAS